MLAVTATERYDVRDAESDIIINIVVPRKCVRVVAVNRTQRIAFLNRLFPNEKREYIYNGQMLNENHTMKFYNLKSHDSIVALPACSDLNTAKTTWIRLTRDNESFSESVNTSISKRNRGEYARLS